MRAHQVRRFNQFYPILCYPVLFCLILPYTILPRPFPSHPIPSHATLPHPILPHPIPCCQVRRFILKRDLKTDPENQAVEDALCLVFLQHQFAELLVKKGADEMVVSHASRRGGWGGCGCWAGGWAVEGALCQGPARTFERLACSPFTGRGAQDLGEQDGRARARGGDAAGAQLAG